MSPRIWIGAGPRIRSEHVKRYTRARVPTQGGGDHPPPSAIDDTRLCPTRLRRFCAESSLGRHDADHLAGLDRLASCDRELADGARTVRMHLVLHLHRLDDADDLSRLDLIAFCDLD